MRYVLNTAAIKRFRNKKNMTHAEMARRLGYTPQYAHTIIYGQPKSLKDRVKRANKGDGKGRRLTLHFFCKLADVLGVPERSLVYKMK